jgi:hypothetical protein
MRALKILLAGLVTAWLAAMLTGCAGYQLGPVNGVVAGDKSIEILPFNNQTLQPRLGDAVTQALRERIQTDATFHLATRAGADIVVSGLIKDYNRQAIGYLSTDAATPEDYRIEIVVHVTARDMASGKLLVDKDVRGHTLVHIGTDLASAERQALPLLAEDLAQTVTELLTEGSW